VKYYSNSWTHWKVMALTMSKTSMCIVTLTSDFRSRLWHFLRSGVTILWNIIPINAFSENLSLNHYEHSDLDLWTITLDQGHDTSLSPGQQSCEILFKFIKIGHRQTVHDTPAYPFEPSWGTIPSNSWEKQFHVCNLKN
jgi:hypothetical protein